MTGVNMMTFLNMFHKEKEEPTAIKADDRLSLVLSYQRSDIDEKKIKRFQEHLIQLCQNFGYDVVGKIEVVPQSRERTTIINASIPVKLKDPI
jgi:cell division topological specificity factor